jgi:uncharacterized repeat protein (TIGR03803 family)
MAKLNRWVIGGAVFYAAAVIGASAQRFQVLANLNGSNGSDPILMSMVQGVDGNFYGTTELGGNTICSDGCGTIFKITPSGTLTTLYSFDGSDGCSRLRQGWEDRTHSRSRIHRNYERHA